jgi:hypothetical protein
MKPEVSLPCLQQSSFGTYPEPPEFNPDLKTNSVEYT